MSIYDKLGINTKDTEYKKLLPPRRKHITPDKFTILSNDIYQMDLMTMPPHNHYNYILCIVNMRTKISDVEALRNKTAGSIIDAFGKMMERNIIEHPIKLLYCDMGSEFINKQFKQFCKSHEIGLVLTRANNHKQAGIIEATNGQYKKYLQIYLAYHSQKQKSYFTNWVKILNQVRDYLNEERKKHYPKHVNYLEMEIKDIVPKYKIGDKVHIKLDYPQDAIKENRLHGTFRYGDLYFTHKIFTIVGVNINPGKNIRYTVEDDKNKIVYGSYLESELIKIN